MGYICEMDRLNHRLRIVMRKQKRRGGTDHPLTLLNRASWPNIASVSVGWADVRGASNSLVIGTSLGQWREGRAESSSSLLLLSKWAESGGSGAAGR